MSVGRCPRAHLAIGSTYRRLGFSELNESLSTGSPNSNVKCQSHVAAYESDSSISERERCGNVPSGPRDRQNTLLVNFLTSLYPYRCYHDFQALVLRNLPWPVPNTFGQVPRCVVHLERSHFYFNLWLASLRRDLLPLYAPSSVYAAQHTT